jgi:threonine dehydrogenase-like Zn-dependent dehydrogenase
VEAGDVMGHGFMGVVHEIGHDVKMFKKGDRAVASFDFLLWAVFVLPELGLVLVLRVH